MAELRSVKGFNVGHLELTPLTFRLISSTSTNCRASRLIRVKNGVGTPRLTNFQVKRGPDSGVITGKRY